jgi:hypothetical protein
MDHGVFRIPALQMRQRPSSALVSTGTNSSNSRYLKPGIPPGDPMANIQLPSPLRAQRALKGEGGATRCLRSKPELRRMGVPSKNPQHIDSQRTQIYTGCGPRLPNEVQSF